MLKPGGRGMTPHLHDNVLCVGAVQGFYFPQFACHTQLSQAGRQSAGVGAVELSAKRKAQSAKRKAQNAQREAQSAGLVREVVLSPTITRPPHRLHIF